MKTPDNSIDFVPVTIEDVAKVESPAIAVNRTPEENQVLDAKFAAAPAPVAKPEDVVRAQEIATKLANPVEMPATPEIKKAEQQPGENESDKAYDELIKRYSEIKGANLGQARRVIESANPIEKFEESEKLVTPFLGLGLAFVAANASAVPAFIGALAAGSTGVVTGAGIAVAGIFGVLPIVLGAGWVAYVGHKLFKNLQSKRRIARDEEKLEKAFA